MHAQAVDGFRAISSGTFLLGLATCNPLIATVGGHGLSHGRSTMSLRDRLGLEGGKSDSGGLAARVTRSDEQAAANEGRQTSAQVANNQSLAAQIAARTEAEAAKAK